MSRMNYNLDLNLNRDRQPLTEIDKYGYDKTTDDFLNIIAGQFPEIKQSIYRSKDGGLKALVEYWKMNQNKKNKDYEKKTDKDQEEALQLFNKQKRFNTKSKAEKNLIFDGDIERQLPKDVSDAIKNLGLSQIISINNGRLMAPHNMTDFERKNRKYSAYSKQQELKPMTNLLFNSLLEGNARIVGWGVPRTLSALSRDLSKINRLPEVKILKSYISGKYKQRIGNIKKQIAKDKNPKQLAKKVLNMKKYLKEKGMEVGNVHTNYKNFISPKDYKSHEELIKALKSGNLLEHKDNEKRIQGLLDQIIDSGDMKDKKDLAKYAKYSKKYIDEYL